MNSWKVIKANDEITYPEQEREFQFSCLIDILAWSDEDYMKDEKTWRNHQVLATVKGEISFGRKIVSVTYQNEAARFHLGVKRAVEEAKNIIEVELAFIIDDYYEEN